MNMKIIVYRKLELRKINTTFKLELFVIIRQTWSKIDFYHIWIFLVTNLGQTFGVRKFAIISMYKCVFRGITV